MVRRGAGSEAAIGAGPAATWVAHPWWEAAAAAEEGCDRGLGLVSAQRFGFWPLAARCCCWQCWSSGKDAAKARLGRPWVRAAAARTPSVMRRRQNHVHAHAPARCQRFRPKTSAPDRLNFVNRRTADSRANRSASAVRKAGREPQALLVTRQLASRPEAALPRQWEPEWALGSTPAACHRLVVLVWPSWKAAGHSATRSSCV